MIIVTTDEVAGYEIVEVLGETMGAVAYNNYGWGSYTASDGPAAGTATRETLVQQCRAAAMNRLWIEAAERGANAVVGMRYDLSQLAEQLVEACAYGTAVVLRPRAEGEPGATPQSARQARQTNGGPGAPSQPPPTSPPWLGAGPPQPPPTGHQAPTSMPAPPAPRPAAEPPGDWPLPPHSQ
ncbi:YbjQ family protein [Microlunatus parietis]|uniref:Uncharacterized protein YbjQ (UPF0145 family) n=1 Tax=Microlunatus parietis TaxID=682979 RepID=A0A7Y9I7I2_9ACTN|nr:heavy metal-binding domain-containing protein [Microlunatus parietis]NYE71726.1 uncharacterized protein YbjQ (UPF0145 family) [Microlunatus parietis]